MKLNDLKTIRVDEKKTQKLICYWDHSIHEFTLTGQQMLGRASRNGQPDINIPAVIVSRSHGMFETASGHCRYKDLGSSNGTLCNDRELTPGQMIRLHPGDVLRIRGKASDSGEVVMVYSEHSVISEQFRDDPDRNVFDDGGCGLSIHLNECSVKQHKGKKVLLKDIRLNIPDGQLVLILGGSGAGKTTFMNAVMGYEPGDGEILYHGKDIYKNYASMKYEIGYVPQKDLLRLNDTVYATLLNAAKMRIAGRNSEKVYQESVEKTLRVMGLVRERLSMAGKLSGGQRKRLSIAVEYIGNPALFFLDEPDSGLDGSMAENLMKHLREIADEGKIVMAISHSPDRVADLFDQVIVLAKDTEENCGRLVFEGSPREACDFFDVDSLEAIVRRISRREEGGDGLADFYIAKFGSGRIAGARSTE